jgi:hypothetical protein
VKLMHANTLNSSMNFNTAKRTHISNLSDNKSNSKSPESNFRLGWKRLKRKHHSTQQEQMFVVIIAFENKAKIMQDETS